MAHHFILLWYPPNLFQTAHMLERFLDWYSDPTGTYILYPNPLPVLPQLAPIHFEYTSRFLAISQSDIIVCHISQNSHLHPSNYPLHCVICVSSALSCMTSQFRPLPCAAQNVEPDLSIYNTTLLIFMRHRPYAIDSLGCTSIYVIYLYPSLS